MDVSATTRQAIQYLTLLAAIELFDVPDHDRTTGHRPNGRRRDTMDAVPQRLSHVREQATQARSDDVYRSNQQCIREWGPRNDHEVVVIQYIKSG